MLAALGEQDRPLSELTAGYSRYAASGEINSVVADVTGTLDRVEALYSEEGATTDRLDGLTVDLGDGRWFNLRPSNTEPLLRLNVEAPSRKPSTPCATGCSSWFGAEGARRAGRRIEAPTARGSGARRCGASRRRRKSLFFSKVVGFFLFPDRVLPMTKNNSVSRVALKKITPDVSAAMGSLHGAAVSAAQDAKVEPELLELIRIRASQLNGCAFCLDMHTKDARAADETEQRIYALNAWRETPFFSERERAALALTEAVTFVADGHVPDDVYAEAAAVFDEAQVAALIWRPRSSTRTTGSRSRRAWFRVLISLPEVIKEVIER